MSKEEEEKDNDATLQVLNDEIEQTASCLNRIQQHLQTLENELNTLTASTPLAQDDLRKRIHRTQFQVDSCKKLIHCLEQEKVALQAMQQQPTAQLELAYGNAALLTNRARTQLFSSEDEHRLQAVLKETWNGGGADPPSQLLRMYQDLCDFHRRSAPDITRMRRQQVGKQLCAENIPLPKLDLFTVTWNVGDTPPLASELEQIVPMETNKLYDMVVVGVQECGFELTQQMMDRAMQFRANARREAKQIFRLADDTVEDLPTTSQFMFRTRVEKMSKRAVTSRAGDYLASLLLEHLGPDDYLLMRACEFSNMRMFCFVRREHAPRVAHIEYASQSTGVAGVAGNKGGVCISFRFQQIKFCFISCHLAAHRKFTKDRNADLNNILAMTQRKLGTTAVSYTSDWDFVFVIGDLNYRLDLTEYLNKTTEPVTEEERATFNKTKADHTEQERRQVMSLIASEQWNELIKFDQLRAEQRRGTALFGFREAELYPFAPTFKLVDRTNEDLKLRYAHNRLPAYCDRILWYITPGIYMHETNERMSQVELFSPQYLTTSDHNPVCSRFLINLGGDLLRSSAAAAAATAKGLPLLMPGLSFRGMKHANSISGSGMQIVIWNLKARGLVSQDPTGRSDPYIAAYSPELFPKRGERGSSPLLSVSRTGVCFQTLDCEWKNTVLAVRTPPKFPSASLLRGKHITLAVRDFDFSSFDDSMGEVVLCLDDLVTAYEESTAMVMTGNVNNGEEDQHVAAPGQVYFRLPVIHNGTRAGEISGMMALRAPLDRTKSSRTNSDYMWKGRALWEYATQKF